MWAVNTLEGLYNDAQNLCSMFLAQLTAKRDEGRRSFVVGQDRRNEGNSCIACKTSLAKVLHCRTL